MSKCCQIPLLEFSSDGLSIHWGNRIPAALIPKVPNMDLCCIPMCWTILLCPPQCTLAKPGAKTNVSISISTNPNAAGNQSRGITEYQFSRETLDHLRQEVQSIQNVPAQLPPVKNISAEALGQVSTTPSAHMHEGQLDEV